VGQCHIVHSRLHIGAHDRPELGIAGQPRVIHSQHEASHEAAAKITHITVPGMHLQHRRLIATLPRVTRRSTQHLTPISRKALDMLRMLPRMRERMIQLRIRNTPSMMGRSQSQKRRLTPSELKQRGTHAATLP
jgi:exopolyphosphatase/pppGpp-phosphohydrolase